MVDDRRRPTPLVDASSAVQTPPTFWQKQDNFGGDAHPTAETRRVFGGRGDRSSTSTEVFEAPVSQGYAPGTFNLLQPQQVGTYVPAGSSQQ